MIVTMAYAFLVATLLGLAALFGERICGQLGWPRRWIWCAALAASLALPAYAVLIAAETSDASFISLPLTFELRPNLTPGEITAAAAGDVAEPWLTWPNWVRFDSVLPALWIASSMILALVYALASVMLGLLVRRSRPATIGDQPILVSDDVGPAVFGFIAPRIVLPGWLAEQESNLRSLVLRHEREHVAARDHLLLIAALTAVAVMPWNISLWWQLRRLRAAIEMDCDARVLRKGVDARSYSEALLLMGERHAAAPLGTVALIEPVSELEQRIKIILESTRRFSAAVFGSRLTLVIAVTALALLVNAPNAQQDTGGSTSRLVPTIRTTTYEQLVEVQKCMEEHDIDCGRRALAQVRAMKDLNTYETAQLYSFDAYVDFNADDSDGAIGAFESVLSLPRDELPAGLVRQTMHNLASLYIEQERYEEGLATLNAWLDELPNGPSSEDLYMKSTVLYQMERYEDALELIEAAIAQSEVPDEAQYQLLYALQFQAGDQAGAIETLEFMNSEWPDKEWGKALDALRAGNEDTSARPGAPTAEVVVRD